MKWFFRIFFRTIRAILGPILLFIDKITPPKGMVRSADAQSQTDEKTKNLILYQFRACPFCIKVRRETKRLSLKIETRDALRDQQSRQQLEADGGRIKVPCLKITDDTGKESWMYDSNTIIQYLQKGYA